MNLTEEAKEVIERTEWISITTCSELEPHTVAAWGHRLREIGIQNDNIILLPVGKYIQTEENLKRNSKVQLLMSASNIKRADGKLGQGYRFVGKGQIKVDGDMFDLVKVKFPWARGAFVIKIEEAYALI